MFAPLLLATLLVVANQNSDDITIVDTHSMSVVQKIRTGVGPHEAIASPDGKTAFVSLYGRSVANRALSIVDVPTRTEIARIDLSPYSRPHGLAQRGGKIFITAEAQQSVLRFDPATRQIDWVGRTLRQGSHMLAVTSDGKRVYAGNVSAASVSVIDVGEGATADASTIIPVGDGPEGIALSPDDRELWVAHRFGGGISIIDTRTNAVVATIAPQLFPPRVAFTPDGRKALASDGGTRSVVVFDTLTRVELGRIRFAGLPNSMLVAPDSKTLFVTVLGTDTLERVNLETYAIEAAVVTGAYPDGLTFASDGNEPQAQPGPRRRSVRR